MKYTAKQLASILGGTVDGNPDETVTSFAKIENGKAGQLCFFANPKYEHYVYTSKASVLLVNADFEPKSPVTPTMIRVKNAYSAVAQLLKYVSDSRRKYRRHRGFCCHVAFSAKMGPKVWIGDYTKIGAKCSIGERTIIHDHVSVGEGTVIGTGCIIYPGVRIYPGMVIGNNVILHANCVIGSDGFGNAPQEDGSWRKIEHLGNVIIGDDVEIGANTTVDRHRQRRQDRQSLPDRAQCRHRRQYRDGCALRHRRFGKTRPQLHNRRPERNQRPYNAG